MSSCAAEGVSWVVVVPPLVQRVQNTTTLVTPGKFKPQNCPALSLSGCAFPNNPSFGLGVC